MDQKLLSEDMTEENGLSEPLFGEQCFELMEKYRKCLFNFTNTCICEQNIANEYTFNSLEEDFRRISERRDLINGKTIPIKCEVFTINEINNDNDVEVRPDSAEESEELEDNSFSDGSDEEFIPSKKQKITKRGKTVATGQQRKRKKYVYFNFKCDWIGCERKYSKKDDLMAHVRSVHTKEKPFKCDICDRRFTIEKFLKCHQKGQHNIIGDTKVVKSKKRILCDVEDCGKSFGTVSALHKHKSTVHSDERPYVCEWPGCNNAYKIKESLLNHRAVHSDEHQFKCDIEGCLKTFQTKWNYYSHMKRHKKKVNPPKANQKYACHWPGCNYNGNNKQDLTIHMNRHMNIKPYKCQNSDCDMSYFTSYELKQHIIKVHEVVNESDREFKCHYEGCQRKYAVERDLKRHLRRHDRIYVCSWPECGQRYAAKQLLSDHMDRHMNVKSFHCHFAGCLKSFFSKTNYEGHMKRMHKYNPNKINNERSVNFIDNSNIIIDSNSLNS